MPVANDDGFLFGEYFDLSAFFHVTAFNFFKFGQKLIVKIIKIWIAHSLFSKQS